METPGVAVGLATIGVAGAALLFSAEHVLNGPMTFIERHLGFSPDGGEIEILVAVMLVMFIVVIGLRLATK